MKPDQFSGNSKLDFEVRLMGCRQGLFKPARRSLIGNLGNVLLRFESEDEAREIQIKVWKAYWLWPLIITILLSVLVAYIVS